MRSASTWLSRICRNAACRAGDDHRQRVEVDRHAGDANHRARRLRRQHVPDAQHEFLQVKRLGQVLVGADLEPLEPVFRRVQRRHEHDGNRRRALDLPRETKPRAVGQPDVDDRQIPAPDRSCSLASPIVCTHDDEAIALEPLGQRAPERRVVFDEQHPRASGGLRQLQRDGEPAVRAPSTRERRRASAAAAAATRRGRRPCRCSARRMRERPAERSKHLGRRAAPVVGDDPRRRHASGPAASTSTSTDDASPWTTAFCRTFRSTLCTARASARRARVAVHLTATARASRAAVCAIHALHIDGLDEQAAVRLGEVQRVLELELQARARRAAVDRGCGCAPPPADPRAGFRPGAAGSRATS